MASSAAVAFLVLILRRYRRVWETYFLSALKNNEDHQHHRIRNEYSNAKCNKKLSQSRKTCREVADPLLLQCTVNMYNTQNIKPNVGMIPVTRWTNRRRFFAMQRRGRNAPPVGRSNLSVVAAQLESCHRKHIATITLLLPITNSQRIVYIPDGHLHDRSTANGRRNRGRRCGTAPS